MLLALFHYAASDRFEYVKRDLHEVGETGWEAETANELLSVGRGNCYYRAALFGILARAVGYDAAVVSGLCPHGTELVGTSESGQPLRRTLYEHHAWVELDWQGETCVFDAQFESTNHTGIPDNYWAQGPEQAARVGYAMEGKINEAAEAAE